MFDQVNGDQHNFCRGVSQYLCLFQVELVARSMLYMYCYSLNCWVLCTQMNRLHLDLRT